jgi:hypothetical protein
VCGSWLFELQHVVAACVEDELEGILHRVFECCPGPSEALPKTMAIRNLCIGVHSVPNSVDTMYGKDSAGQWNGTHAPSYDDYGFILLFEHTLVHQNHQNRNKRGRKKGDEERLKKLLYQESMGKLYYQPTI